MATINEIMSTLWKQCYYQQNQVFEKVNEDNFSFKLVENTSSVGFVFLHMAETQLFFANVFFGTPMDVVPLTLRTKDEGQVKDMEAVKEVIQKANKYIYDSIKSLPEEKWLEVVEAPFGKLTRVQGLGALINHTQHHIGQAIQAIKKGKTF